MRVNELFHKIFKNASSLMDKRISKSLLTSVNAALGGAHLSTTSLGRHLEGEAKTKNKIKRVSRLFSNPTLQKSFINFYQDMANLLLSKVKRPIILVDGSLFSTCGEFQFLSASTPAGGRSLPLLEQAFHRSEVMSSKAHKVFLEKLQTLLPEGVKPIVVYVVPNPAYSNLKIIANFKKDMKKFGIPATVYTLESYINTKILFYLLKQIEGPVTKEAFLKAAENIKGVNLDGIRLDFNSKTRQLSHTVWFDKGKDEWQKVSFAKQSKKVEKKVKKKISKKTQVLGKEKDSKKEGFFFEL